MGVNELKHMFNLTAGMISFGVEKLVAAAQTSYYNYPVPKVLLIAPAPVRENIADMIFGFSYGPLAYEKSMQWGALYRDVAQRVRLRLPGLRRNGLPDQRPGRYSLLPEGPR